jgi:flagellar hook-basal body complex protein FliE
MESIKGFGTSATSGVTIGAPNGAANGITAQKDLFKGPEEATGGSFADTLRDFYHYVDGELQKANQIKQEFAVGKRADLHEVMIASEKADLSFRLLLQMRNKMLEAYQEIMRMHF